MARKRTDSWETEPAKTRRKGFSLRGLFLIGLLAVVLFVWFAPTVLMRTSLRDTLISKSLGKFPGRVVTASGTAGWLSPVTVTNASVTDANGGEVIAVGAIKTEKTLFALLTDTKHLGKVVIEQPKLNLLIRPDGSNLEDLVRPLLEQPGSSPPRQLTIEIIDGSIAGSYAGANNQATAAWSVDKLNGSFGLPGESNNPIAATISAEVGAVGHAPGQLSASAELQSGKSATSESASYLGSMALQTNGLPLDLVTPWLRLMDVDVRLGGVVSSNLSVKLAADSQSASIKELKASDLYIQMPRVLGQDALRFSTFQTRGDVHRSAGQWQVQDVVVESDAGTLQLTGTAPAKNGAFSTAELTEALRSSSGEVHARIDLAKAASMLPHLLHVRDDTRISAGKLSLDVVSAAANDGRTWDARLQADQFSAVRGNQQIVWREPIMIEAVARESSGNLAVERLKCQSSFLQVSGQGSLQEGRLSAQADLSSFLRELGQFVDLAGLQSVGKLNTDMQWNQEGSELISLSGTARATDFELSSAALKPWREKDLQLDFSTKAKVTGRTIASFEAGQLDVKAAGDALHAELRGPVSPVSLQASWPTRFTVQGDIARWMDRLQMFFTTPDWEIAGQEAQLAGDANVSAARIDIAGARGSVKNFQAFSPSIFIREPKLEIEGNASYDVPSGEFTADRTTISSTSIALRADQLRVAPRGNGYAAEGNVNYRANLERLTAWLNDPKKAPTFQIRGNAAGSLDFVGQSDSTQVKGNADIEQFAYATPANVPAGSTALAGQAIGWVTSWEEPRLELSLEGSYDSKADRANVTKLQAAGESISVGAQGSIERPFERCIVNLSGQYAYDLERLTERMRGVLGPQVAMKGRADRPFSISGPLFVESRANTTSASVNPATRAGSLASTSAIRESSVGASSTSTIAWNELDGQASLAWDSLLIQGFQIGKGELSTQLNEGKLAISPIELPVSEGTVRITPQVDLNQSPTIVSVSPGTIVDQVRITPEACRTWLKYVAPLVADATAAEGKFSVSLADAKFPVSDPTGGNVEGQLKVHSAQIGPGPLAQEILAVAEQVKSLLDRRPADAASQSPARWLEMPEQQLNFQLADHRVYHRDLQMAVKDIVIRTQGWVGINQQLALMAEVPVRDEWVANDRYLSSLKGQTIKLPIQGTLSRPQVDRRALAELGRQTVREAGTNFLQEQLNRGLERGLDRFFQPKAPSPNTPPATP